MSLPYLQDLGCTLQNVHVIGEKSFGKRAAHRPVFDPLPIMCDNHMHEGRLIDSKPLQSSLGKPVTFNRRKRAGPLLESPISKVVSYRTPDEVDGRPFASSIYVPSLSVHVRGSR
jgi:hypothetical protein